jgi:AcrR family transcriptional regulator
MGFIGSSDSIEPRLFDPEHNVPSVAPAPATLGEIMTSLNMKPAMKKAKSGGDNPKLKKSARPEARQKLLDAAERLFADKGYDGTSVRDIALAAHQHVALSNYYFGTKEKLFEEVIQRRAVAIEAVRLAALAEIDVSSMTPSDAVRALIEAYALPMIKARYGSSKQWQAHARLMSQVVSVKYWVPVIRKYYDTCGLAFIAKFHEALPQADHDSLLNSFSFMISNMLYVCSYTNRFSKVKTGHLSSKKDVEAATQDFIQFTHAGLMALYKPPLDRHSKGAQRAVALRAR